MRRIRAFKHFLPIVFIFLSVFIFFWPFFSKLLLPIPTDNIVGMYHPFLDFLRPAFTRGVPFKNYLIADPIKQQYPWRELGIALEKKSQLPLWNPYSFSGTPLLANVQSAPFYPFNLLFFVFPFPISWSLLISLEPLLAALFLYLYLGNIKLSRWACVLGALSFAFCGFFTAWLEWGTILHVGLWLPIVLLAIDKLFKKTQSLKWMFVFIFSLSSSFFGGHLQVFFYVCIFSASYFLFRFLQHTDKKKHLAVFVCSIFVVFVVTAVQLFPVVQFIQLSARSIDQQNWMQNPGWFVPWSHLVQFVVPDFFGNPATRNYTSIFNYGEFIGYFGIFPLLMAITAIWYRRDKESIFFIFALLLSILFAFPTGVSNLPFLLKIPFISTSQPTRLMFVIDFSLAVLSAFGFDYFLSNRKKINKPLFLLFSIFCILGVYILIGQKSLPNLLIAKRNFYLPAGIYVVTSFGIFLLLLSNNKKKEYAILVALLLVTLFDLIRFDSKFNVFQAREFLFPQTKALTFLKEQKGLFRIMTTDEPVFPPNFSISFRLQSLDGYDPLYLKRYAELVAAIERNKPNIQEPYGFNKIVSPHNIDSKIIDILGPKYVLSRIDLKSKKLTKVLQEGKTRVYENASAFPRAFFVEKTQCLSGEQEVIEKMFVSNLQKIAYIENNTCASLSRDWSIGKASISSYSENIIIIKTENENDGFLVFFDSFYPTWHAKIHNRKLSETKIFLTDFNFRGIVVPKGKNEIEFYNTIL